MSIITEILCFFSQRVEMSFEKPTDGKVNFRLFDADLVESYVVDLVSPCLHSPSLKNY